MADEIVQQLGFDAAKALEALDGLDAHFGTFESRLSTLGDALSGWNSKAASTVAAFKEIASGAVSAADALAKLSSASSARGVASGGAAAGGMSKSTMDYLGIKQPEPVKPAVNFDDIQAANKATKEFTVSWQTLSRVVQTQMIVRTLSMIRDAMKSAFESNLEFNTRVAEIQSIAPGTSTSIQTISDGLARMSREFNIPLMQTAEAQYQTLSNQFVSSAQQTDVLTAAFKLSKVAVMDAGAAVNLIAGTLNAYHMSSDQAEKVAAKLFGTIQLGRVRGEELASTMGKVTAVSSELGVGLEELDSMIVTLTISGVKPAEAMTQLRSSMMSLLKPSKDLQQELRALGFESGPQMINALGLEGTFLKLRDSVDENMQSFAKLIPNSRAISGVLRETDDQGRHTTEALQKLHQMTEQAFNEKYKLFIESDAQKTLAEMNKLKVFLTTDLGASVVEIANKFLGFAGGADAVGRD